MRDPPEERRLAYVTARTKCGECGTSTDKKLYIEGVHDRTLTIWCSACLKRTRHEVVVTVGPIKPKPLD